MSVLAVVLVLSPCRLNAIMFANATVSLAFFTAVAVNETEELKTAV